MRLIHCADIHLDSKLNTNFSRQKADVRRAEILSSFVRMVEYAEANQIEAILIAGDLFDTDYVAQSTKDVVMGIIKSHPDIVFYYLRGNHDVEGLESGKDVCPDHLKVFSSVSDHGVQYYEKDLPLSGKRLVIAGMELPANAGVQEKKEAISNINLREADLNILMLHGQLEEDFFVADLAGKHVDYAALGHVHGYDKGRIDGRGVYCYPGCLEARGYDECGAHGFVILDIDEKSGQICDSFIPFAKRHIWEVLVDVTDCSDTFAMKEQIELALANCRATKGQDMVRVVLTGQQDVETQVDYNYLEQSLKDSFFEAKLVNHTTMDIDPLTYANDISLKGEFIRQVMADATLSDQERMRVISLGIKAIMGEELSL